MLELERVSYEVEEGSGNIDILSDVSFVVESGSFVVITGPNGGGKSTLAKLIMGVIRPTAGRILLDGRDITSLDITARAQAGIGFAFQQPVRFKGLMVRDLLSLAAGKDLNTEETCLYLSEVGLCAINYVDRELDASLSGGELKRIEIAMVLARRTPLSIFDEPEAGIDLWSFHNLIRAFQRMRDATEGAIVIISHQERILDIADRIVVIADGAVAETGAREDILPQLLCESGGCSYYREEVRP